MWKNNGTAARRMREPLPESSPVDSNRGDGKIPGFISLELMDLEIFPDNYKIVLLINDKCILKILTYKDTKYKFYLYLNSTNIYIHTYVYNIRNPYEIEIYICCVCMYVCIFFISFSFWQSKENIYLGLVGIGKIVRVKHTYIHTYIHT